LYEQALKQAGSSAKVSDLRGPVQLDISTIQGDVANLESLGHLVGVKARWVVVVVVVVVAAVI